MITSESTISLKFEVVSRNHDLTAQCGSKVNILTSAGVIVFDDHKVQLSDAARTKLTTDLGVKGLNKLGNGSDNVKVDGLFNDIGAFELTCDGHKASDSSTSSNYEDDEDLEDGEDDEDDEEE